MLYALVELKLFQAQNFVFAMLWMEITVDRGSETLKNPVKISNLCDLARFQEIYRAFKILDILNSNIT